MTTPYLTLERVSYLLPDGSPLFSGLDETFDQRPTGLVGRNGAGKTVLARILAGQLPPSSGRCLRSGSVFYLAQQVSPPAGATVASLAGVQSALDALARIVELSSLGLRGYGGNYSVYAASKAHERANALERLEHRKLERRREEQAMQAQRERQERRQARGQRHGKQANQARILLDRQKGRSEDSAGRLKQQHAVAHERLAQAVREAAAQVENDAAISLHALPVAQAAQRRVAQLDAVTLPFVAAPTRHVSLLLGGQQRVAVTGPNGCGKSTLLKVLAGQLAPLSGARTAAPESVYLDQRLAGLASERPVLEQLQAANPNLDEGALRTRLAHLGLDARKILAPSGSLSGGERLKAALACALYADPPPRLLLLDEPGNHLDLPSMLALESLLRGYAGALVVVSHDEAFLDNLALTDRLRATQQGWLLEPW